MPDYWIKDSDGRVLGPVSVYVLRDLIAAGRLDDIAALSVDGRKFSRVADFPDMDLLVAAAQPDPQAEGNGDPERAEKLHRRLAWQRTQPDWEVFGVRAGSDLSTYRAAFFALAKKVHPDRVPEGFPALRAASAAYFRFLAERLHERQVAMEPKPPAPKVATQRLAGGGLFDPRQFIGLEKRAPNHYEAKLRITRDTASIFTAHSLVNFKSCGVFIPGERLAPLGSDVDLLFHFVDPTKDIRAQGKVVWENAADPKHPKGFGVRYRPLSDAETIFIRAYVARAKRTGHPGR